MLSKLRCPRPWHRPRRPLDPLHLLLNMLLRHTAPLPLMLVLRAQLQPRLPRLGQWQGQ